MLPAGALLPQPSCHSPSRRQGQARTLYPKLWLCLGTARHSHPTQPGEEEEGRASSQACSA